MKINTEKIEQEINFIVEEFKKLYDSNASLDVLTDFLWLALCPKYYDERLRRVRTRDELYKYITTDFKVRYRNFLINNVLRVRSREKSEIDFNETEAR